MKHILKRLLGIEIKEKWVAVLSVILMTLLMLPLIGLAFYSVPYFDDYLHIRFPKSFLLQYGGIDGWFQGVCYAVKSQYYAWQGTYSTQFIVSANPIILGEEYYGYSVIFVILLFVGFSMFSVYRLTRRLLNMQTTSSWIMAVVVTVAMFELIYTAQQGVYWFNGAIHYTLMHGIMLLMLTLAIEIFFVKTDIRALLLMILVMLLGVVVAGSNFVTILQCFLALLTICFLGLFLKKKRIWFLLLPVCVYSWCLYKNISAPGNAVRASYFEGYGVVESILHSFKSAFLEFWNLSGFIMLVMLLLVIPVIVNAVKKMDFSFRYPGLITIYSICLYATGFTASYYGMGNSGVGRTWIVVKFTLQLLLFVNEIYWVGWITKKLEVPITKHYLAYYACLGGLAILIFGLTPDRIGTFSSFGALYYLYSGEAECFYKQYEQRLDEIKQGDEIVELKPYTCMPYFLCIGDLSTNPTDSANSAIAQWYGKEAIYIKE